MKGFTLGMSDLNLKKSNFVMELDDLDHGGFGTPPNFMNTQKGQVEYIQLSLFDPTFFGD